MTTTRSRRNPFGRLRSTSSLSMQQQQRVLVQHPRQRVGDDRDVSEAMSMRHNGTGAFR